MRRICLVLSLCLAGVPVFGQEANPDAATVGGAQDGASIFESDRAELVSDGHMFVEGPCWVPGAGAGFFLFCERDGEGGTVWKWTGEGKPEVWRRPSGQAIGTAVDARGYIYQAESGNRRIVRVPLVEGRAGEPEVLAERHEGRRLNATNDVVVKSDGSVYFTDPTFFTKREDLELDFLGVWRRSPTGELMVLDKSLQAPNGLCFSPDEKRLYVNDFRANEVRVFDVKEDGTLENGRVFAKLASDDPRARGRADGVRCDALGNVYTTGPAGILVFSPEGKKIGEMTVPGASNLAFGGEDGRRLLITAGRSVWTVRTKHAGAVPARQSR
jgi:sugar lactone lactonase YvrE